VIVQGGDLQVAPLHGVAPVSMVPSQMAHRTSKGTSAQRLSRSRRVVGVRSRLHGRLVCKKSIRTLPLGSGKEAAFSGKALPAGPRTRDGRTLAASCGLSLFRQASIRRPPGDR
jgi:hypothetical protein